VWDPFGTLRQALWIRGGQWEPGTRAVATVVADYFSSCPPPAADDK
jgi:hypothetical protein